MSSSQRTQLPPLPASSLSTPVRSARTERGVSASHEPCVTRTPLALRNAQYDYLSLSASPKKRKEVDGEGGGRYMDGGRGRGMRAEGSPAREAIRRPASTTFHLPGYPRLTSFTPFPTPTVALRRISSTCALASQNGSMANHQLFDDLPAGLLMQHTGDVSDSSFFAASELGDEGDEDQVDVGDVSFQLEVEVEPEMAEGLKERMEEVANDAGSEPVLNEAPAPVLEEIPAVIPNAGLQVAISQERTEEVSNKIGAPGYVPSRIKDIETRQRRPIAIASPLRPSKKQRFVIHQDEPDAAVPVLPPSSPRLDSAPSPAADTEVSTTALGDRIQASCTSSTALPPDSSPAPDLSPFIIETIALPLPPHILSPILPSLHPNPTLDPIIDLTSRLNSLLHQKLTLTSENSTLIGERSALWAKTHENDARITRLLEEKVNLQAQLKSSRKDNEELRAELEGRNSVCEKLCVLVKDAEGDGESGGAGEEGGEGREAKRRRIVDTVVMMSQAGMLDSKHWSNQGVRSVLQKRKDGPESFGDSSQKRTCR